MGTLGRSAEDVLKDLLSGDNADPSSMLGGRKGSGDLLRGGRGDSQDPDGRRGGSTDPYGNRDGSGAPGSGVGGRGGGGVGGSGLPEGKAKLNVIKAKELIKSDMIGKSDPYVVLRYGRQQDKTKVVKNTQEPKWDHQTEFVVPDGDSRTFHLEVFDSDRIGKDKSLGKLDLDLANVLGMDGQEGRG